MDCVLQVVPVERKGSSVRICCKKVITVIRQVLSDSVYVSSRVEKNWSAVLFMSSRFEVSVYNYHVVVTESWYYLRVCYV